jgi:hypothetical protein
LRASSHGNATGAVRVSRDLTLTPPIGASEAEARAAAQDWYRNHAVQILGNRDPDGYKIELVEAR